jgi:gliding motility-associated-like protein
MNTSSYDVIVHPKPTAQFTGQHLAGCSPICAELESVSSGIINNYWWTINGVVYSSTIPSLSYCMENSGSSTDYYDVQLIVETNLGCLDTALTANYLSVYPLPIASFTATPLETTVLMTDVEITNQSQQATHYQWYFGNGLGSTQEDPTIHYASEPSVYTIELIAFNNEGCVDTSHLTIEVKDEIIYYVPNTFTPDGDEFNQTFQPVFSSGYDAQSYVMQVYNRWGELIFESYDVSIGWDGTYHGAIVQQGTYVWKIQFKSKTTDYKVEAVGHVNVIR